ncbi:MAG: type 4a pilus biogenesis protein PilO [candidate division Zixibacteria bacterium]|nr:type 4a pilus biogenesis protein PilO [candidate division Zixibacteria bacterium]
MDLRDPKNQILSVIVAGFIILFYIWYSQFYSAYEIELNEKKAQNQQLEQQLFSVRQQAKSLDALQEEYNELLNRYEKVKLWLPEVKEDEAFLAQMHIAAQLANSTIISVTPQVTVSHDYYSANSYLVEVESTYHNLGSFYAKIVNFPFIVTISDVKLKSIEEGKGLDIGNTLKQNDHTVSSTFKLTSYNSNQGGQTQ